MEKGLTYATLERLCNNYEELLNHLLESNTIALFAEVNPRTGEYRRNIKMLDALGLQDAFERGVHTDGKPIERPIARTIKEIKTIKNRLDNADDFDDAVNAAIADGWKLMRRDVLPPMAMRNGDQTYSVLYAELERDADGKKRCCEACGMDRCTDAPCVKGDGDALKAEPKLIDCTTCKHNEDGTNHDHCRKCETYSEWEEEET